MTENTITTDTTTTLTFEGSLTSKDSKTYHPYSFEVPEGIANIQIDYQYTPRFSTGRIHRNQMDICVDDPDGIRGVWSRSCEKELNINGIASTPGFTTAPIQPGTWTVYVAAHRILSPDTVNYTVTVKLFTETDIQPAPVYDGSQRVARAKAGWYRGDLHGHTMHSDGFWEIPEFTAFQRGRGLDFVTLSDHNAVTGLAQHRSQTEDGFLAMGGIELTTMNGHMLALGKSTLYEWRLGIREGVDVNHIMQKALEGGSLLIIAHPMSPDEPFCSGCHWMFEEARPGAALGVEVWNGYWHMFNEDSLQQYYTWLNLGHHLVATSGSDIHGEPADKMSRRNGFNVVYAEELSETAILEAIRKGHSYISAGPELLLTAETASGQRAMVGDTLPAEAATLTVKWQGAHTGDVVRVIVDGAVQETVPADEFGQLNLSFAPNQAKWCVIELRDANKDMWALTNPIFFSQGQH